jgi:TatD DNase family protein
MAIIWYCPDDICSKLKKVRLREGSEVGMELSIVDIHAHLDMDSFNRDRTEVIARALEVGVSTIITVGTDLESSKNAIRLAESHAEVLASVGFDPHEASKVKKEDIADLAKMAQHPRVVAIGEIGLDFYRNYSSREAQLQVLEWQLGLATRLDLPVVIHCRQAEKDMLTLLRDWTSSHNAPKGQPRGVIHCFSGDIGTAQQYLDMGFFISLGAYIGYPSSRHIYDVIRAIPRDRLVLETDSPFLPPQAHRGQRNEPSYLPLTAGLLAEIRGVSPETIARETTRNARHLFRIAAETEPGE